MRRLFKAILLSLVALIVVSMPVLAAVSYSATYTIIESAGTPYDMLPTSVLVDNQWLADNGFMELDALDTRIETFGGLPKPHVVATNKTLTAVPVPADSQTNLYFTTANDDLSPPAMDIIEGYDGYVTTPYDVTLELGTDFEIEMDAYFDTSDSNFVFPMQKRAATSIAVTDTDEISGIIYFDEPVDVSPAPGDVGAWTDIDITEYVPAYATGAVVRLYTSNVVEEIGVRINGSAQQLRGDVYGQLWTMVGIDADDVFQGWIEAVTCHIYLVGFTGSGVTYKTVADNISLVVALAWTAIDLSVEAPDAIGVIVAVDYTAAGGAVKYGLRMNGSADARDNTIANDGWYYGIIGCDGGQIIEGYVGALTVDFYLVGYITADFTFNLDATDKSLVGGFDAWTAIDCSTNVPINTNYIIFEVVAPVADYGFRRNGSAENIHPEHSSHCWVVVECDSDYIVQMWADDNTVDCYIVGYTQGYIDDPYDVIVTATGISSGEYVIQTSQDIALDFATNDDVDCGDVGYFPAGFSLEAWIQADTQVGNDGILSQDDLNDGRSFFLDLDAGRLSFTLYQTGGAAAGAATENPASMNVDTWYHVAGTFPGVGGTIYVYINGAEVANGPVVGALHDSGDSWLIGDDAVAAGRGFDGAIAEARVYSRVLSPAEVLDHYNGIFTDESDLEGFWKLDEGAGATVVDSSGEGNTGTITGATWDAANPLMRLVIDSEDLRRFGEGGASVPDEAETDWQYNLKNATPYINSYEHTVSGVEHAWYQPNYMVVSTDFDGTADAGGSTTTLVDAALTQADDYWNNALLTIITTTDTFAPQGETSIIANFDDAADTLYFEALTAGIDAGDTYTVDFGTLIDRSYYGLEFDAVDDIVACGADASMDITVEATLTAWVYIDSDGENNEGSIIDRRDAAPDGYRLYVSSEAAGDVAIEAILDGATDAYAVSNVDVSISGWHYIVAVYNRLGTFHWEIYEDSVLLGLGTDQAGVAPITGHTANVMNIGDNAASNRCFDGRIDEPSFYTTAWDQALVTANYNAGSGLYTPSDATDIELQLHIEEGSGAAVADTSGEANNGTIVNAVWVNGKVPRPAGNSGTNDSRVTWGVNPTGVAVSLGGMVSEGQPTPGALPSDPAQDILPETEVTDWFIEPVNVAGDITGGPLLTNPLRPFVTMWSDNTTLTELQCWRLYALAIILLVTVATALSVGRHQGITAVMAGVTILGAVVLTIFPMLALVFAIGMFIGGLVMERSPSL